MATSTSKPAKGKAQQPDQQPPISANPRRRIDWEAVERDYRTGRFTLRELADKHGPNNATIGRRAERGGWTKDLAAAIRQATSAKLIAATTQQECSSAQQNAAEAVLGAAEIAKNVILGQRGRVGRAVAVSMRMLDELDATTTRPEDLRALFDTLIGDELDEQAKSAAQAKFNDLLRLHTRVGSAQKLMDALNRAQIMERQAFSIDDAPPDANPNLRPLADVDTEELRAALRREA